MVAPLLSPGLPRRLLPFAVFLTAFSVVMMILFMSMDIRAIKHREQFNFTQDLDFHGVAQDNPQFIAYIRAIHLQLPPVSRNTVDNTSSIVKPLPHSKLVAKLLNFKKGGVFVEAGAYQHGKPSDTEWLELALGWHGFLVQPDPRDFLVLQRQRRHKALSVHACLSPTPYPKEVTFRQVPYVDEETGTEQTTFTRVKCFPLFSLLQAANMTTVDYMSLHAEGAEKQVLKTLPFDQIRIQIISVDRHELDDETALVTFMAAQSYKLVELMKSCYVFKKEDDTTPRLL